METGCIHPFDSNDFDSIAAHQNDNKKIEKLAFYILKLDKDLARKPTFDIGALINDQLCLVRTCIQACFRTMVIKQGTNNLEHPSRARIRGSQRR